MRLWQILAAMVCCVVACGCVRSVQPILKAEQVRADPTLAGDWKPADGKGLVQIQAPAEDKSYKVIYTDEDGKKGTFIVRLGKIQDLMVAELSPDDPALASSDVYKAHLMPLYSFFLVDRTSPDIQLRLMKPEWLEKYVKEHPDELQLLPEPGKEHQGIVTSSTDQIQAFLLRHQKDADAFGEPARLLRVAAPPTTRP